MCRLRRSQSESKYGVASRMREVVDDLHPKRKCPSDQAYGLQFTQFTKNGLIKSKIFDVTIDTVKDIVGTQDLGWETFEKDVNGKYVKKEG